MVALLAQFILVSFLRCNKKLINNLKYSFLDSLLTKNSVYFKLSLFFWSGSSSVEPKHSLHKSNFQTLPSNHSTWQVAIPRDQDMILLDREGSCSHGRFCSPRCRGRMEACSIWKLIHNTLQLNYCFKKMNSTSLLWYIISKFA